MGIGGLLTLTAAGPYVMCIQLRPLTPQRVQTLLRRTAYCIHNQASFIAPTPAVEAPSGFRSISDARVPAPWFGFSAVPFRGQRLCRFLCQARPILGQSDTNMAHYRGGGIPAGQCRTRPCVQSDCKGRQGCRSTGRLEARRHSPASCAPVQAHFSAFCCCLLRGIAVSLLPTGCRTASKHRSVVKPAHPLFGCAFFQPRKGRLYQYLAFSGMIQRMPPLGSGTSPARRGMTWI